MNTIFDEVIDRRNTNSLKYDFAERFHAPKDAIPLWVADMDFKVPEEVMKALHERVEHGIFGYTDVKEDYFEAVADWFFKDFGWRPESEWLVKTPGVVFAISHAIRAFTKEKDSVLIQQPVYYPFLSVIKDNNRTPVNNELLYENGHYEIDFADFQNKIIENKVKLFILCSPHNPVGRVWTKPELLRLAKICLENKVVIISDEIHCDFTYEGHPHTVFAGISKEAEDNCIVCTAPSKTFNLAGLQISNIWIKNKELRDKFKWQMRITGYEENNVMGLVACKAAYRYGGAWLSELKAYLKENLDFVRGFIKDNIPEIKIVEPEGTYLIWLDCSGLGMEDGCLSKFMLEKAKVWLDAGSMFGKNSGQFVRINMTCPRSVLEDAMMRIKEALQILC